MSRIVTQAFTTTPDNSLHIRKARLNFHNVAHTLAVIRQGHGCTWQQEEHGGKAQKTVGAHRVEVTRV